MLEVLGKSKLVCHVTGPLEISLCEELWKGKKTNLIPMPSYLHLLLGNTLQVYFFYSVSSCICRVEVIKCSSKAFIYLLCKHQSLLLKLASAPQTAINWSDSADICCNQRADTCAHTILRHIQIRKFACVCFQEDLLWSKLTYSFSVTVGLI